MLLPCPSTFHARMHATAQQQYTEATLVVGLRHHSLTVLPIPVTQHSSTGADAAAAASAGLAVDCIYHY